MSIIAKIQPIYWIMESPKRYGRKHVANGPAIAAAIFGPFWAASKGAIAIMCGMAAFTAMTLVVRYGLEGVISQRLGNELFWFLQGLYTVVVLAFANHWYKRKLDADGYTITGYTRMKHPSPPAYVGETIVRHYAMRTWKTEQEAQAARLNNHPIAGYVIGHHQNDMGLALLTECGPGWSLIRSTPVDSMEVAMAMTTANDRAIHGDWRTVGVSDAKISNAKKSHLRSV